MPCPIGVQELLRTVRSAPEWLRLQGQESFLTHEARKLGYQHHLEVTVRQKKTLTQLLNKVKKTKTPSGEKLTLHRDLNESGDLSQSMKDLTASDGG